MDLTLTPDQESLLSEVSAFLREQLPVTRLHGGKDAEAAAVRTLGEMGWLGMSLPEGEGGAGFSVADEALVFRELGRVLGPVSALAAAVAGRPGAGRGADGVLSGEATVAVATPAAPCRPDRGEGTVRLFSNGPPALAVLAQPDGAWLFDVKQAAVAPIPCLDPGLSMYEIDLAGAPLLGGVEDGGAVWRHAMLLLSALNVGASEAVRDLTADYARMRTTFGRPIGAYQAVRHPIAEMAARSEQARSQLFFAALAIDAGRDDVSLQVSALRVLAQQAASLNADAAIQLHGAIGVTDDYDAHLFMKRAAVFGLWLGGARGALKDALHRPMGGV